MSLEFLDNELSENCPATLSSRCVYLDEPEGVWTTGNDVCEVRNNLALQLDDHVKCFCKHMSHYAVVSTVSDPDVVGYNIWFYVACFVCMVSSEGCSRTILGAMK